jgi:uncharacterized membrane protein
MLYVTVAFLYILCHGLTTLVVFPLQKVVMPEVSLYASVLYLPHGVRVLATWAMGWRAIPALFLGLALSNFIFLPADMKLHFDAVMIPAVLVGAASSFLAFEAVRFLGFDLYYGGQRRIEWRGLVAVGALASLIHSVLQSVIHSDLMSFEALVVAPLIYVIGDVAGLVVCMLALMFLFRSLRRFGL